MGALEAGPPQSPIQASLCRLHWSCEELSMFSNSPAYALVFIASLQRHALQPSPLTRHSSVRPELRVELQTLWLNCTCTSGPRPCPHPARYPLGWRPTARGPDSPGSPLATPFAALFETSIYILSSIGLWPIFRCLFMPYDGKSVKPQLFFSL